MEIQQFTGGNIRLGDFPHCVDVSTIKYANNDNVHYHSSHGSFTTVFPGDMKDFYCIVVIAKCLDTKFIRTCTCKWDEMVDAFLDERLFPKGYEIIYDSRVND